MQKSLVALCCCLVLPFFALAQSGNILYELKDQSTMAPIKRAYCIASRFGKSWYIMQGDWGGRRPFLVPADGLDSVTFFAPGYEGFSIGAEELLASAQQKKVLLLKPTHFVAFNKRFLRRGDALTLGQGKRIRRSEAREGPRLQGTWVGRRFKNEFGSRLVILSEAIIHLDDTKADCTCALELFVHALDSTHRPAERIIGPIVLMPEQLGKTLKVDLSDLLMPTHGLMISIRGNSEHIKSQRGACQDAAFVGPVLQAREDDMAAEWEKGDSFVYDDASDAFLFAALLPALRSGGYPLPISYGIGLKVRAYGE